MIVPYRPLSHAQRPWKLLLSAMLLLSGFSFTLPGNDAIVADRIVRFVNDEVITQGEIWEEMRLQLTDIRRRGGALPEGDEAMQALRQLALKELTEQILLDQEAQRLGIILDRSALRREVRDWIRDQNLDRTVLQEANEIKRRSQRTRSQVVLRHYLGRSPAITPSDIHQYYAENQEQFAKPQRARGGRILIRAASEADQRAYLRQLMTLIQQVQLDAHPAVATSIDDERLSAIARADESQRPPLMLEALQGALATIPENPPRATQRLAAQITEAIDRQHNLRSADQVRRTLQDIRDQLLSISAVDDRRSRFAELAQLHSQGPQAEDGGDLGWQEIGSGDASVEELLYSLPIGGVSSPFQLGDFHALVMVLDRDQQTVRSLREVTPAIRAYLQEQRTLAVRQNLIDHLRAKATIRDLENDPTLPAEWFAQP